MLCKSIKSLFNLKENRLLTPADIAEKLKKDKVRISGFLDAMVEYGDLSVKKAGNSKVFFLNDNS